MNTLKFSWAPQNISEDTEVPAGTWSAITEAGGTALRYKWNVWTDHVAGTLP
jgi:hypothetical protein